MGLLPVAPDRLPRLDHLCNCLTDHRSLQFLGGKVAPPPPPLQRDDRFPQPQGGLSAMTNPLVRTPLTAKASFLVKDPTHLGVCADKFALLQAKCTGALHFAPAPMPSFGGEFCSPLRSNPHPQLGLHSTKAVSMQGPSLLPPLAKEGDGDSTNLMAGEESLDVLSPTHTEDSE